MVWKVSFWPAMRIKSGVWRYTTGWPKHPGHGTVPARMGLGYGTRLRACTHARQRGMRIKQLTRHGRPQRAFLLGVGLGYIMRMPTSRGAGSPDAQTQGLSCSGQGCMTAQTHLRRMQFR